MKRNGHTSLFGPRGKPLTPSKKAYVGNNYYQATQNRMRRWVPAVVNDSDQTMTAATRSQIIGLARYLHANIGMVRGAVNDLALYSVGTGLIPQSQAERTRAQEFEDYFRSWAAIADTTGRFTFSQMQRLASLRLDVDGDIGFVMVETKEGYPQLQMVEGHRVTNDRDDKSYVDGVRTDKVGRPLGYSLRTGDKYRRVAAKDFILVYDPERADQQRGMSSLAHAINNIRDVSDILDYEKTGVKMASAIGVAITTESGAVDAGSSFIESGFESTDTQLAFDTFQAGMVPRLKTGESIDSFASNRPNPTFQGFLEFLVRDVAVGLGVPVEFIWDTSKLSGATQRFVMAKASRAFEARQQLLISRLCDRVWRWVIAKGIKRGDLKDSPNWWRVSWQRPARITVDVGREASANLNDIRMGTRTIAEDAGERGVDWLEMRDQSEREASDLIDRAKRLADAHGISLEFAVGLLSSPSPNPPTNPVDFDRVMETKGKNPNE